MNSTVTLTPKLQIRESAPPAPRLSIGQVLWYKLLKWIEKSTSQALFKSCLRLLSVATLACVIFAPSFVLGYLTAILQWNNYRIPIFFIALALMLNWKRGLRLLRRVRAPRGNQHAYNGLPVPELADFLLTQGAFKRDTAIPHFGLSQGQYAKIAAELEEKGVLTRGEANARVLRPIGRAMLVRQLQDGFPLVWDPERSIWAERDGMFNQWVLKNEFKQRRLDEAIEKKQRRLERIEEKIEEAQEGIPSPLTHVFAHSCQ